jgi:hypothetical protein
VVYDELEAWIRELSSSAIKRATNGKTAGMWVEVVRVRRKYFYVRIMCWKPGEGKKLIKHLGPLEEVKKQGGYYAAEAERLERKRLARAGRKVGINP